MGDEGREGFDIKGKGNKVPFPNLEDTVQGAPEVLGVVRLLLKHICYHFRQQIPIRYTTDEGEGISL